MSTVDVMIVLLVVLSAMLGFATGLIRSVFSLFGLIAGIAIASWNYKRVAHELAPHFENRALADAIWFCLIALGVMVVCGLAGWVLKRLIHGVGLGWLDRLAGLLFGLLRGAVLVTLCIVTLAAFFPETAWLANAQLARYFLGSAHLTAQMTPDELKARTLHGLQLLESKSPGWLHVK